MATNMVDTELTEATDLNQQIKAAKKCAKWIARFFTFLYIVFFPFFFYMGMLSSMILQSPSKTVLVCLTFIFLTFLPSLSMPISIYFIWSRYSQSLYKKMYFFCALPVLVFLGWFILAGVLDKLAHYFA